MYSYQHPHPAVTTDTVVFARADDGIRVLLVRRRKAPHTGRWALPGGFVEIDESLESAALRELREETGITGVDLTQLHAFGRPNRDPRERVISIAYYTILPSPAPRVEAGSDAAEVGWFPLESLPPLAFDHEEILRLARSRARV